MKRPCHSKVSVGDFMHCAQHDCDGPRTSRIIQVHLCTWGKEKGRVQSVTTDAHVLGLRGLKTALVVAWSKHGWTRFGARPQWGKYRLVKAKCQ